MVLEICTDSVESAIAAECGGAQRVELCSNLLEGGVTPSVGITATVRDRIGIDLFVMIRPRGGDFCYTDFEFEVMQRDIQQAHEVGVDGVVLGILDQQARIDVARTRQLVELANPLPVTFHRAIDMTPDPRLALEDVIAAGAKRVLTSGAAPRATEGLAMVAMLVQTGRGRIGVIAGGGITPETIAHVAQTTGVTEFHASLRTAYPSPVAFHRPDVQMGETRDREYLRYVVEERNVCGLRSALDRVAAEREAEQAK